jgi:hypothetical protein
MTTTAIEPEDAPGPNAEVDATRWLDLVRGRARELAIDRLSQAHLALDGCEGTEPRSAPTGEDVRAR